MGFYRRLKSENRSTKIGYGLWLFIALAVLLKVILKGTERSVYPIFANASENWWQAQSLYSLTLGLDLYRYSPTFAFLFTPFSLDVFWGHLIWILGAFALLFVAVRKFYFHFGNLCADRRRENADLSHALGAFLILTALGAVRSVWNGQSNILLIALVILGLVMLSERKWWMCALFLVSAVFIKIWPLALCGLLAMHFPRQLIPRFVIVAVALAALPFLTQSNGYVASQYVEWSDSLLSSQLGGQRWPGFRDAWTIWEELIGPVNNVYYFGAQVVTGILTLLLTFTFKGCDLKAKIFYIFASWLCWQLLFGPGTERATYSILAPMFALAAVTHKDRYRPLLVVAGVLYLVFTHGSFEVLALQVFPFAKILIPLAVVILLLWLLLQSYRWNRLR